MNNPESIQSQDNGESLKQSGDEVSNSVSSVLVQDPSKIELKELGISLGELGIWNKDNFVLNENLIQKVGDKQYLVVNGLKYLITERYDKSEGLAYKIGSMRDEKFGLSPFFFVGYFSCIDGNGVLVRKDGYIYEGRFVVSDNEWVWYSGSLRYPNGDFYEGDFIEGEPLSEKSAELTPFKRKGVYTRANGDRTTYRYYGEVMRKPYFMKGKDKKPEENWAHKRGGVLSVIEESAENFMKGKVISWGHTTDYVETDEGFVYETGNGKRLVVSKRKGEKIDREIANLLNAIKYFYEKNKGKHFFPYGDNLKYRYGKLGISFSTMLSDVSNRSGAANILDDYEISRESKKDSGMMKLLLEDNNAMTAKNLARWLNDYYAERNIR